MKKITWILIIFGLGLILTACSNSDNLNSNKTLVVTNTQVTLQVGQSTQINAEVRLNDEVLDDQIHYKSDAAHIASVNQMGLIQGESVGTTIIRVQSNQLEKEVIVTINKSSDETPTLTVSEVYNSIKAVQNKYALSAHGHIVQEIKKDDVSISSLEYIYNFNGASIESLKLNYISDSIHLEGYIDQSVAYMNYNNTKSKMSLTNDEVTHILVSYNFSNITQNIFNFFHKDILDASNMTSFTDELVVLNFDISKFDTSNSDISNLIASIKVLELKVNYKSDDIVSITAMVTNQLDVTSQITLYFNGLDVQAIDLPSDLAQYPSQD